MTGRPGVTGGTERRLEELWLPQVAIQFLAGGRLTASGLWAANLRPPGNLY